MKVLTKEDNKIELLQAISETCDNDSLKAYVINDILEHNEPITYLKDVLNHGCSGGLVNGLIYYSDTEAFYNKHQDEIHDLIADSLDEGLLTGDCLKKAFKSNFANWCAWYAYESTAYNLVNEIELDY